MPQYRQIQRGSVWDHMSAQEVAEWQQRPSSITADSSDQEIEIWVCANVRFACWVCVCKQMEKIAGTLERGVSGDLSEECTSEKNKGERSWVACTWHIVKLFSWSLAALSQHLAYQSSEGKSFKELLLEGPPWRSGSFWVRCRYRKE